MAKYNPANGAYYNQGTNNGSTNPNTPRPRLPQDTPNDPAYGGAAAQRDYNTRTNQIEDYYNGGNTSIRDLFSAILDRTAGSLDLSQLAQRRADYAQRAGLLEAFQARDTENQRYNSALQFLQQQFQQTAKPSMTQGDINNLYSREADLASSGALRNFSNLRGQLGVAGIFGGGVAAGLGSQIELQRLGQITGAKRDLAIQKAQMDAQDRVNQFQQALGVAAFQNQSPSMLGIDALQNVQETSLAQQGIYTAQRQAELAAAAAKSAGKKSLIGDILGGGLSLLGGIFG